jgi:hypothetical protein
MNQQPDKLFRDKVADLKVNVPANAWSRVEANLDKKNKGVLWLKIAASLLIVALGVFYFMPKSQNGDVKIAVKKQEPKSLTPKQDIDKSVAPSTAVDDKQKSLSIKVNENKTGRTTKKLKPQRNREEKKIVEQPTTEQSIASTVETQSTESVAAPLIEEKVSSPVVAQVENKPSHISIVITSTEADEKYLDKKSLAEATSEEKKSSTLRKLLDTAYDLKIIRIRLAISGRRRMKFSR